MLAVTPAAAGASVAGSNSACSSRQVAWPFSLVIVVVWTAVLSAYTAFAERASHLLTAESARRWLNRCAAGAIVGRSWGRRERSPRGSRRSRSG